MNIFPQTRPAIRISASDEKILSVDCPELQWWFAVPRDNEEYAFAYYDTESLALDCIATFTALNAQVAPGCSVVEFEVRENWFTEHERQTFPPRLHISASSDADNVRFLAVTELSEDGIVLTKTDAGTPNFEEDWGSTLGRSLEDNGRFEQIDDDSWRTTERDGAGAGTYDVTIGAKNFLCLRVLDYDRSIPFGGELAEAYIDHVTGRTVLYREFSGRYYRQVRIGAKNAEKGVDILNLYPNNTRIVIDGELYVHCGCAMRGHDVVTLAGIGGLDNESSV